MPSIIINREGESPLVFERPEEIEKFLNDCLNAMDLLVPDLEHDDIERVDDALASYGQFHDFIVQINQMLPAFNAGLIEERKAGARRLANGIRTRKGG